MRYNGTAEGCPLELVDTHAHLGFAAFDHDREVVIERARAEGVGAVVTIALDAATAPDAVALAKRHAGVFAAVGIHPLQVAEGIDLHRDLDRLTTWLSHPKVVAVGEAGLDFYREGAAAGVQRRVFEAQLELAAASGLPVIIHQRQAEDEVLEILGRWRHRLAGVVVHCFTGDAESARRFNELDVYFGIGGVVTFPNAGSLRKAVAEAIPPDRILLETDAPFLAPQPRRGKRNEPAYVAWVAEAVAACLTIPAAEAGRRTTANARRLFRRLAAEGAS